MPNGLNGRSLALYGLASLPEAFELVCMLPAPSTEHLVQAGLQLLGSGYDAVSTTMVACYYVVIHLGELNVPSMKLSVLTGSACLIMSILHAYRANNNYF